MWAFADCAISFTEEIDEGSELERHLLTVGVVEIERFARQHVALQDKLESAGGQLARRGVTLVTEPFILPVIHRKLAFIADPFGNLIELAQVL